MQSVVQQLAVQQVTYSAVSRRKEPLAIMGIFNKVETPTVTFKFAPDQAKPDEMELFTMPTFDESKAYNATNAELNAWFLIEDADEAQVERFRMDARTRLMTIKNHNPDRATMKRILDMDLVGIIRFLGEWVDASGLGEKTTDGKVVDAVGESHGSAEPSEGTAPN